MASGDGLILRVKPRCATLSLAQARCVAQVSQNFGNGALDLTSHANLQIRGLAQEGIEGALAALDAVGLVDADPVGEAVRNVLASPLAGLDPTALLDIRPFVAALEGRLTQDETLRRLPAKTCFAVDDGGTPGLGDCEADVTFRAARHGGAVVFEIGLGGDALARASCAPEALVEAAAALGAMLVEAGAVDSEIRRMRHLVRLRGAQPLFDAGGLRLANPSLHSEDGAATRRMKGELRSAGTGMFPRVLRVAAPFGRLSAARLTVFVDAAGAAGARELRLTPWRAFLVPGVVDHAPLVRACEAAGFILDPADPRLRVAACPGAPGCRRGSTAVLEDAARLAATLDLGPGAGLALHVSGCAKGCAHAGAAPVTLVGREGRYDVVVEGRASDAPLWRGMTIAEIERALAGLKAEAVP